MRFTLHKLQSRYELLQFLKRYRSQFVTRRAMQSQLDYAISERPRQGTLTHWALTLRLGHPFLHLSVLRSFAHFVSNKTACLTPYISSISSFIRAVITSRFSFPFTVSIPLSIEKASSRTTKARTSLYG